MDNLDFENKFDRFKKDPHLLNVNEDFESRVFDKIKKKKKQRKVTASVAAGFVVFAFIFIGQAALFHKTSEPIMIARPESTAKEEIPVTEDVVFASSDSRSDYAIEQVQVAYNEDESTI